MAIFAQQVWADDYFNPALLDIDNPSRAKPIYPSMKKAQDRRRVNIRSRSLSIIIKLIPVKSRSNYKRINREAVRFSLALASMI
jgi:hypothetical protein